MATFEEFFLSEHIRLYRVLYVITGSRQEAEDIAQDAFLKVLERWNHVGSMDDPAGYLHRTAMNLFRDRYRRAALAVRRAVGLTSQADAYEAVEARDEAVRVLGSLSPRQRAAIVLTEYLGYSAAEAGRFLGIRDSTVRALHFQARTTLRRQLEASDV